MQNATVREYTRRCNTVENIHFQKVIQWFNEANCCQISPTTKELLFGIIPSSKETKLIYKFNYTTLAMRHYIYSNKINSKAIYMHEFINKLSLKYSLENIN